MKNSLLFAISILFFISCQKQQYTFIPASKVAYFQSDYEVDKRVVIDEKAPIKDTIIDIHDTTVVRAVVIANDFKKSNQLRRVILKKQLAEKRKEEQKFANQNRNPEAKAIHRSAVKSLVLGITSISLFAVPTLFYQVLLPAGLIVVAVLMGIVAILMGVDAYKRNKATPKSNRTDKKIAIPGIITGMVGSIVPLVVVLLIFLVESCVKSLFRI